MTTTQPLPELSSLLEAPVPRAFLFGCGRDACWVFDLPGVGSVSIGRGEEAALRLSEESVSREHACLRIVERTYTLEDLGSHNGTRVNGERITAPRTLQPGDRIQIGAHTLVFSAEHSYAGPRPFVGVAELWRRMAEEIDRSVAYDRCFTVVTARIAPPTDRERAERMLRSEMRSIDLAAWSSPGEMIFLFPEVEAAEAQQLVERLKGTLAELDPEAWIGAATCPADGSDAQSLLFNARGGTRCRREVIGEANVLIAEPSMVELFALVGRLAASDIPVLVRGETGTGKELIALALHHWSPRRTRPLIAVNCAALPEHLVESELFGHEKGAFTGADSAKEGMFLAADGGTLFLDEVGELSLPVQAKLLRAIESRRITRLGSREAIAADVRIVVATNRDLQAEIRAGRFRQDFYFRICGGLVSVPPLRDRRREIPPLAQAFLDDACRRMGRESKAIAALTLSELVHHSWPGNVRELKQLMEYAAAAIPDPILLPHHVAERLGAPPESVLAPAPDAPLPRFRPIRDEIADLEQERMQVALAATGGVQARAAELIGMPLRTFVTKMKRYRIRAR